MNIAYHMPSLDNIYAQRTIYHGYKNAFEDSGHDFFTFTSGDDLEKFLEKNQIHIFITSSHFYYQKYLNLDILRKYRKKGMIVFTKIDFWKSPLSGLRINESKGMKDDVRTVQQIKDGLLGDVFFHAVEQSDERMEGFEKETGYKYYTIPLAADKTIMKNEFWKDFIADISYIGTFLPEKRNFFKECVFPLKNKYNVKLYGQDWTVRDRLIGWIQKFGQYYNISYLSSIQKPKLHLGDEAKIYSSSKICINVHEEYQKKFGGDCNERTFKIPLCGGFEITDDVACIRKYFKAGKEIIIAKDMEDWFEKIDFYMNAPDERSAIIEAGRERVLKDHTYHNRSEQILSIYSEVKKHG
ncbi:Glycosyl transferases group 1 [uncultured archaeon]|nr:Glycosyl transferases group 1 [uncultured archaeon]